MDAVSMPGSFVRANLHVISRGFGRWARSREYLAAKMLGTGILAGELTIKSGNFTTDSPHIA